MKKIFIILITGVIALVANAQPSSLYYMTNLRQTLYTNPAKVCDCGFSFSFPVVNMDLSLYSNPLKYSTIFSQDENKNFYVDLDKIAQSLGDYNFIEQNNRITFGSFGIRIKNLYFNYDYSLKTDVLFYYPKGLFDFLANGNPDGVIDLSGFGINTTAYTQSTFNLAYKISSNLTIGGAFKFNRGLFNLYTSKFDLNATFDTSETGIYAVTLNGDYELQSAGIVKPYYDNNGNLTFGMTPDFEGANTTQDIIDSSKALVFNPNTGIGIDFGVVYSPVKFLELSASVIDLGFINWRVNATTTTGSAQVYFDGYDLNDSTQLQKLLDTLQEQLQPKFTYQPYKTSLYTKIYLGAAFKPTNYLTIGLHYKGIKLPNNWYNIYTAGLYLNPGYKWSFTVNYSIYPHSTNNLGVGMALNLGPMQIYFLTDNIALPNFGISYFTNSTTPYYENSATLRVKNMQLTNFMFGINFNFGCKDRVDYGLLDE